MPRRFSKAEVDRFLGGRRVAVLGTNGADGSPVLTPIWYLYTDGHLLMRTDKQSVKAKNIARDPRVTVCVQDERPPYASVTVYGKAAIEPAQVITPERVLTQDFSQETPWFGKAWLVLKRVLPPGL